jgi:adenosylhomocysteine nucleosidase
MIAITFALPTESSELLRRLHSVQRAGNLLFGKIDNHAVTISHTGVGPKNCGARMETLLHKAQPRLLISSGFAGAVGEDIRVGDLTLAENFSDPQLLANAEQILRGRDARVLKLFTSQTIIDSISDRNEIARSHNAAAVDMETEAIAEVCAAHRVPMLSVRAISDSPREPFPAPASVLFDVERQRIPFSKLIAYLITHPSASWRLARFSRRIAQARTNLSDAIVALVREL